MLYFLYKLLDEVVLDPSLKQMVQDVFEERKPHASCHSAKDGIGMNAILQEIIDRDIYKQDYENITAKILFEKSPYETVITALQNIIHSGIFSHS